MQSLATTVSQNYGRISAIRHGALLLLAFFFSGKALSQEWMPQGRISFYETALDRQTVTSTLLTLDSVLAEEDLSDPFDMPPSRPYGFGRELDDRSPVDSDGLWRDTGYFFGYQFFIIATLYVMPESVSAWSDEQKEEYNFAKWRHNITHPRWDPDDWYINYILHPYWGMTYYIRGRERGLSKSGAFWYSFGLSSLYEFGLEALFEPVSYQDVIVTPGIGSLIGLYAEELRRDIKSQREFGFWDKTLLIATDPLGTLNTLVDDLLGTGVQSDLQLQTFYRSPDFRLGEKLPSWDDPLQQNPVVGDYLGLELTLRWH